MSKKSNFQAPAAFANAKFPSKKKGNFVPKVNKESPDNTKSLDDVVASMEQVLESRNEEIITTEISESVNADKSMKSTEFFSDVKELPLENDFTNTDIPSEAVSHVSDNPHRKLYDADYEETPVSQAVMEKTGEITAKVKAVLPEVTSRAAEEQFVSALTMEKWSISTLTNLVNKANSAIRFQRDLFAQKVAEADMALRENVARGRPRGSGTKKPRKAYTRKKVGTYTNPNDPSEVWSGMGRRPFWMNEYIENGGDPEKIFQPDTTSEDHSVSV